ncbi:aminopeptidase N-like [Centruroides sculpturatus]|uniref:aminopeptidase N-like n=1 Tax=Centruroides sculpturatus TaxID=218467 RepID=UPI000C6CFC3C|nr:aminopeptidase N-like [Centruroides sculpturatus]
MDKLEIEGDKKSPLLQWESILLKNWKWISLVCIIIAGVTILVILVLAIYFCVLIFTPKEPRGIFLPKTIIPHHYRLEIQPHLGPDNFKFNGSVNINFACIESTDTVIFHSKGLSLSLDRIKIRSEIGNDLKILRMDYDDEIDFVILTLLENLSLGSYSLFIEFEGVLQEELHGFYYYSYDDNDDNITEYAALTQFEALHAREAFPCFDEPSLKATFDITIVRWWNMTALSNMPIIRSEMRGNEWMADVFKRSMKMSTYLVAFVIGNFTKNGDGRITIWASPSTIGRTDYALEISNVILTFFERLFHMPYAAPKLDMVLAKSFQVSGMENWGLIIYAEYAILFEEEKDDYDKKDSIMRLVAHEIAHQWFGNLVTMKWWDDIWLNEGLTNYMEYVAYESIYPEWNKIDTAIYSNFYAFNIFDNSVAKKVESRKDLVNMDSVFDDTTYEKGSFVIRMVHHILGNETFWKGINNYLTANSYSNVEEYTLWKYLTEAQNINSKINLSEVMTPWVHHKSFPVISVTRDYEKHNALIIQSSASSENHENLWSIPIYYATGNISNWNREIKLWMNSKNVTIRNILKNDEWLYVDGTGLSYSLINYDRKNWKLLAKQLQENHQVFSYTQRFKLLSDALALYSLNQTVCDTVLDLYLYLPKEEIQFLTGSDTINIIYDINNILPDNLMEDWKNFLLYMLIPVYEKLNLEDMDKYTIGYKRIDPRESRLMAAVCDLGYPPCIEEANRKYNIWKARRDNGTEISSLIKSFVLCIGIKEGDEKDWNYLYDIYLNSKEFEFFILDALLCTPNEHLRKRVLNVTKDAEQLIGIFWAAIDFRDTWTDLTRIYDEILVDLMETDQHKAKLLTKILCTNDEMFKKVESIIEIRLKEINNVKQIETFNELLREARKIRESKKLFGECVENWLKEKKWQ